MFPSSYSNIDLPDHDKMFVTNYYDENPNLLANSEEDGFILSQLLSQSESHEVISNIGQSSSFCNNKEIEKVVVSVTRNTSKSRKKGRHSKICTAQGTRDRRMRLSLQIARKFFDLQDMLGFDKASQTIEWLFSKSKSAIKDLKDTLSPPVGNSYSYATTIEEQVLKDEKRVTLMRKSSRMVGKESRDKARERARERTREKLKAKMVIEQQQQQQQQQQPPPPQEEEEEEEEEEEDDDVVEATNIHQLVEDEEKMIKEKFLGVLRAERSFLEQNEGNSEDDFLGFPQIENNSDFLQKYLCFSYPAEINVKQQPLNMQVQNPSEIVLATSSRTDELKSDTSNFPNNNIVPFSSQTQNPSPIFMIASYNCSSQQHNPNSSFVPSTLIGDEEQNMTNSSSVFLESQFFDGQFHCNSTTSYKNGTFY